MIARLPPAGQRVPLGPLAAAPSFEGYRTEWLGSGTEALALALRAALAYRAPAKQVILPAYGCPDLLAAAQFAGATPVLVDCSAGDPGYDLAALAAQCSSATAAVVAVHFLGIRERVSQVKAICDTVGTLLIEDCAQWFPEGDAVTAADARILSFGRGKPVNLLGGGALLVLDRGRLAGFEVQDLPVMRPLSGAAACAFNALLDPRCYGVVSRVMGSRLGETRFHPVTGLRSMDARRRALARSAIETWCSSSRWREQHLCDALAGTALNLLPASLAGRTARLLRFPVLASEGQARDRLCESLRDLGASPLYAKPLPDVDGVAGPFRFEGSFPGARSFAARLLTLPLHAGVTGAHIELIADRVKRDRRLSAPC